MSKWNEDLDQNLVLKHFGEIGKFYYWRVFQRASFPFASLPLASLPNPIYRLLCFRVSVAYTGTQAKQFVECSFVYVCVVAVRHSEQFKLIHCSRPMQASLHLKPTIWRIDYHIDAALVYFVYQSDWNNKRLALLKESVMLKSRIK